jgi:glucosamine-6-phosphate deaminase
MTVWQIMQSSTIISVVPHAVKADAVFRTLTYRITPDMPATMLKQHPEWHLFLDKDSASQIIHI